MNKNKDVPSKTQSLPQNSLCCLKNCYFLLYFGNVFIILRHVVFNEEEWIQKTNPAVEAHLIARCD